MVFAISKKSNSSEVIYRGRANLSGSSIILRMDLLFFSFLKKTGESLYFWTSDVEMRITIHLYFISYKVTTKTGGVIITFQFHSGVYFIGKQALKESNG